MAGTMRDPDSRKTSEVANSFETLPELAPFSPGEEERRPPVLGVVLSFIILFWGGVFLLWSFWPHHHS